MIKLKPEAMARPGWKRGHYNGTTNLKRNTKRKTNRKRRTKVLKWEGGKIEKNWKAHVERTADEWGSGRFKTKAKEAGKAKTQKREIKLAKEETMKETVCQTQWYHIFKSYHWFIDNTY